MHILYMAINPGAYPEISKGGGGGWHNLTPRQLKLFLAGQAFSLASAYAGLRLPTYAFYHISPFNTVIFFILVYPLCGRQLAQTPRK